MEDVEVDSKKSQKGTYYANLLNLEKHELETGLNTISGDWEILQEFKGDGPRWKNLYIKAKIPDNIKTLLIALRNRMKVNESNLKSVNINEVDVNLGLDVEDADDLLEWIVHSQ